MTTLHLGYLDQPYVAQGGVTTGDVGEILEGKYHICEALLQLHGQEIADALTGAMQGTLEDLLLGAPPTDQPLFSGTQKIETMFRQMLQNKELDALGYPGIPTQASLEGRSARRKKKTKGPPRPSFIDTGLLQSSFRAWVE